MAIRIRKDRKTPFLVYWKNPFTQKIESKSFADKKEADKFNALIQYRLKYERESFKVLEVAELEAPIEETLESIFYQYLQERQLTKDNLYTTLIASQSFLEKFGNINIKDIDSNMLRSMQKLCIEEGNKGTTIRRKMANIKAALNWAFKNGKLSTLPPYPEIPKSYATRYIPPTPEEISRIFTVSPSHLQRVIILGYMFGIRVGSSELMKLKWNDVDFNSEYIRIQNANKGNPNVWREVHIKKDMLPLFKTWFEADKTINMEYLIHYKGKPVKSIRHSWLTALQKAGITRHIRPYDLRHGFATEAIAAGGDYGTLAAIMGHQSPVMVLRHYQHIKDSRKTSIIENMPKIVLPPIV